MADTTPVEEVSPHSLVTEDNVKKVLALDKGGEAVLKSWKIVDFTKKGDNYACMVTSIEVKYSCGSGEECEVTYVVKLNSLKSLVGMPDLSPVLFEKEGRFYQEILPGINQALRSAGQEPLRLPKCFLVVLEPKKEQIYFEDLQAKGYKMCDRRKGLDKDHASLVVRELAKLHSASYLLMDQFRDPATSKFDFLGLEILDFDSEGGPIIKEMFENGVDGSKSMLEKVGGYEKALAWLDRLKPDIGKLFPHKMKSERFKSINHGDCWINNMLFRYDNEGKPLEVTLIDLQVCREVSIASDLNYFLFTSTAGDVRKQNTDHFMSLYYSAYKSVLQGAGQRMYFEEEELLKEYRDKNILGTVLGMTIIPSIILESDEIPDLTETDLGKLQEEYMERAMDHLDNNPLFKPRFLSIFDELMETGAIS